MGYTQRDHKLDFREHANGAKCEY